VARTVRRVTCFCDCLPRELSSGDCRPASYLRKVARYSASDLEPESKVRAPGCNCGSHAIPCRRLYNAIRSLKDMDPDSEQITLLLHRIHAGDRSAENELLPLVYNQLHRLAKLQFRGERPGHTLQPTALMHELYLRVLRDSSIDWQSRAHFYAVAAETMRRILVD